MSGLPYDIERIDPGAEFIRSLEDGDTYNCTVSPPSCVEKDLVYVALFDGGVRLATQEDIQRLM